MRPKYKQILEAVDACEAGTARQISDASGVPYDHTPTYLSILKREGLIKVTGISKVPKRKGSHTYGLTNLGFDELELARGNSGSRGRMPTPWGRVSSVFQMAEVL